MVTRLFAAFALVALSAPAFAQTADGVGQDDDGPPPEAVDAQTAAERVLALADYERKFFQVAARAWAIVTPSFALNGFFDRHTNHWTDGQHNLAYGLEFTTRIPDKYDLVVSLDWTDIRTPDGYWLEDGDVIADADWTESSLSLITADVSLHWHTNLDRNDTLQLYYGVGIGAMLFLGEFRKYDLDTAGCELNDAEARNDDDAGRLSSCFDEQGEPTRFDDFQLESIPPVLPSISLTMGLRYLIKDAVSLSLEGGFKGIYFYGGLELGYFWSPSPR